MSIDSDGEATPTRGSLLEWSRRRLDESGADAPRRAAEWLLLEVVGGDRGHLYAHPERSVERNTVASVVEMVQRCVEGEPLQHVLGYTSFRGLRVDVSPAVMIPRPETEEVVGAALDTIRDVEAPHVLDVGTGSGCIALALKHERPDAVVTAWDVSAEALAVARANARQHGLDIYFEEVDLFASTLTEHLHERVDLLISNPPYIPDEEADVLPSVVRNYDPSVALFSGDDPFRFYRRLVAQAPALCRSGAAVVFETHADYADGVAEVGQEGGLTHVRIETDLSGRPRILIGRAPRSETGTR